MELGDGYEVTYGQLGDIQVEEGTVVARGQVIATVGAVSRYYSVEGTHLYVKITKDNEPVDPLTLLI
jgi:septal ring factor EnvC (AmiA/AmiB activator)